MALVDFIRKLLKYQQNKQPLNGCLCWMRSHERVSSCPHVLACQSTYTRCSVCRVSSSNVFTVCSRTRSSIVFHLCLCFSFYRSRSLSENINPKQPKLTSSMKQWHTINSDCMTILQHKIHYLRIFEFELFERKFVYLSMKMNYHILSNEPNAHKEKRCRDGPQIDHSHNRWE